MAGFWSAFVVLSDTSSMQWLIIISLGLLVNCENHGPTAHGFELTPFSV